MAYYCCWALALVACLLPASVFSQLPPGVTLPPIPGIPPDLLTQRAPACPANQVLIPDAVSGDPACFNFGAALKLLGIASETVKVFVYEVFKSQPSATEQTIILGANELNTMVAGLDPGTDMKQFVVMVYRNNDLVNPAAVVGTSLLGVALTRIYAEAPGVMLSFAPGSNGMTNVDLRLPYTGAMLKQRQYREGCYQPNPMACNYAQQMDAPFALTPGDIHEFLPFLQVGPTTAIYAVAPVRVRIQAAAQANAMPTCIDTTNCFCAAAGYVPVPGPVPNSFICKALGDAILNSTRVRSGDSVQVDLYLLNPVLASVPVWNGTYTWSVTDTLRPTQLALGQFYVLVSRQFVTFTHPVFAAVNDTAERMASLGFLEQYSQNPSALVNQTAGSNGMVTVSSATRAPVVYRPYSVSCRTNVTGTCAYMALGASKALAPGMYEFAPYSPAMSGVAAAYFYPPQSITIGASSGTGAQLPSAIAVVMALVAMVAVLA